MLDERNFYMVMVLAQGEISSYTVLCREAGQAKTLILKQFPGTEIVGVERAFFPKIETRVCYHENLGEYYIIPHSWSEGRILNSEVEICSAALKAGVVLKQIKETEVAFVAR